jgi:hypothetical protein
MFEVSKSLGQKLFCKTILENYFRKLKIVFKTILKIENRIVFLFSK